MRSGAPHLPAAGSPVLLPSLAVLIFMLLLPGAALAGDRCRGGPALEPFERGAGMGYRTAGGEVVLAPRFAMALEFSPQCIAAVVDDRGWAYIDPAGAVLIRPHVVDNGPDPFRDGLARYSDDGKFGFIDTSARVVIEARFAYAEPFDRGYAAVCIDCTPVAEGEHTRMVGQHWGAIGMQGHLKIEPEFARDVLVEQLARLRDQR